MSEKETVAQNTPTETAKTETAAEAKKKQDAADAKTAKEVKAKEDKELADAKAKQEAKANAPFVEIAERYAPHYPDCSAFHITSDKQVFLEGDKAAADEHQAELGKGTVTTIKVK